MCKVGVGRPRRVVLGVQSVAQTFTEVLKQSSAVLKVQVDLEE